MSKRAVLYARVSSDDTRNDGRNLDSQLEMCRDFADQQGWEIVAKLAEDDRGASGASLDLPQLNAILDMAANGEIDVVVAREIDRFSRRLAKQLIIEEQLRRRGVQIAYVLGRYDDTPEGNLLKHVRAVIAEYERLKTAERTMRARRRLVKSGNVMVHCELAPYGYRLSEDRTSFLVYEPEAQIGRSVFKMYTWGGSTVDCAQ
jgi:site-specific DNA recombinase